MKRFSKCILIGLIGGLSLGQLSARADLEVSASVHINAVADFHAPLTPHGTWIEVGTYGRCWRPARVAVGWRPYTHGRWVWTDCGWYWASDEPWGWACYHYGNWYHDEFHGWIWVPGIEWAPAWVSWRFGGGYYGWAPLAPRGVVVVPRSFVYVEVARFHEPVRPAKVIVNNTKIINQTIEVGGIKHETRSFGGGAARKVVVNEGPGVEAIQKATGKTIAAVPIREAALRNPVPTDAATKINEARTNKKPPTQPNKPDNVKPPSSQPQAPNNPIRPARPPGPDKKPDRVDPTRPPPPAPGQPQKPAKPEKRPKGKGNR
jgi:hypothetical protein